MSRIGRMPIAIPAGVDVSVSGSTVTAVSNCTAIDILDVVNLVAVNVLFVNRSDVGSNRINGDNIVAVEPHLNHIANHQVVNSLEYKTVLTAERIKENFVEPESISFWALPQIIRFYEMSGFSALRHQMRYLSLLVSPFKIT